MPRTVAITSCLGELSAGNLYHCVTVGQWYFYDWLKISSARGEEEGQKKKVYTESNLGPLTLRDIGRYAYKLTIAMDRSFIIIIVVLI